MDATIVSMTDKHGKTGNVDYPDCRIPSDEDLVAAASKYQLTEGIRFTITSVVGAKTRFTADIVGGKLERTSKEDVRLNALQRIAVSVCTQEVEKLQKYKDVDFNTEYILREVGLTEEEVWNMIAEKKKGVWFSIPEKYTKAMFNCTVAEYVADKVVDGTI